jgi:hypothetical protein
MTRNWQHTHTALDKWYANAVARHSRLDAIETDDDLRVYETHERGELYQLHLAYYEDTKDINNLERCQLLSVHAIVEISHYMVACCNHVRG